MANVLYVVVIKKVIVKTQDNMKKKIKVKIDTTIAIKDATRCFSLVWNPDVEVKIKPTTKGGIVEQDEPNLYDHLIE